LGDSRSEKGELELKGQKGQGYPPLPAAGGWETADLKRENWISKARRARDISLYLLPVVGRQQI
jgi:hypothetical protein